MSESLRKPIPYLLLGCLGLVSAVVLWAGFTIYMMIGDGYKSVMSSVWIAPSKWQMLEGQGQVTEQGFEMHEIGARSRFVAAAWLADPVDAATIEEVEVVIQAPEVPQDIEFGWSRSRTLSGFDRHWVTVDTTGRAIVSTRHFFRWDGHIRYVLIVARGQPTEPVVLHGVSLHPARPGFADLQRQLFGDWFDWRSWTQVSINRALVGDGNPLVSPVPAVAAWGGLLMVLVLIVHSFREGRRTGPVIVGILLTGWILLDLRWQGDLLFKNAETRNLFWGKSWADKRAVAMDGDVFVFMNELMERSSDLCQRLLIFGQYEFAHKRARYFAMPMETHSDTWPPRQDIMRQVRRGNCLVLVDLPEVQARDRPLPSETDSIFGFPVNLKLSDIAGRDGEVVSVASKEEHLSMKPGGIWLLRSGLTKRIPPGFYRLQLSLAADVEPGWVIFQVLQKKEDGEWVVISERNFYVPGADFETFTLPFAIDAVGGLQYRLRTLNAEGLKAKDITLSILPEANDLAYIIINELATRLVVRPVLESDNIRAYEIQ